MFLEQNVAHAFFMRRVGVGVEKADRHRRDIHRLELARQLARRHLVQRFDLGAVGTKPAGHGEAPAPRNDRFRALLMQVEQILAALPADFDDVAKTFSGDHRRRRVAAFDQRVGGGGAAVHQRVDGIRRNVGGFERVEHAFGAVVLGRQHLRRVALAGLAIEGEQVGEGAADVDAYVPHRAYLLLLGGRNWPRRPSSRGRP